MADTHENNYVVGRGRLFFGQYRTGTRVSRGQRYLGNSPELSVSQSEDMLDHYSSEGGVRVKDASVTLQNDSSGSFQLDDMSPENMALWYLGEVVSRVETGSALASGTVTFSTAAPSEGDTVTVNGVEFTFSDTPGANVISPLPTTIGDAATALAAEVNALSTVLGVTATVATAVVTIRAVAAGTDGNDITLAKEGTNIAVSGATLAGGTNLTETLTQVELGRYYQLGKTVGTPQGVRNISSVSITGVDPASYTVDAATGRILLHSDADDIVAGSSLTVSYGVLPQTETLVIAKGTSIEGELFYKADNPAGENDDHFWPYVKITPDGDFALKGDEWQTVTFNFEILKRDDNTERVYITRRRR